MIVDKSQPTTSFIFFYIIVFIFFKKRLYIFRDFSRKKCCRAAFMARGRFGN